MRNTPRTLTLVLALALAILLVVSLAPPAIATAGPLLLLLLAARAVQRSPDRTITRYRRIASVVRGPPVVA